LNVIDVYFFKILVEDMAYGYLPFFYLETALLPVFEQQTVGQVARLVSSASQNMGSAPVSSISIWSANVLCFAFAKPSSFLGSMWNTVGS